MYYYYFHLIHILNRYRLFAVGKDCNKDIELNWPELLFMIYIMTSVALAILRR